MGGGFCKYRPFGTLLSWKKDASIFKSVSFGSVVEIIYTPEKRDRSVKQATMEMQPRGVHESSFQSN